MLADRLSGRSACTVRNVSAVTRWLPASGLLAAIAFALTGFISPPPPVAGALAADIATYYAGHHTGLELESVADGIGAMLLVVFAATLHSRTRTMASLTAFAAAAIVAACVLVQVAAFQALAFRPSPDPPRAALLNDLQSFTFQVATFPTLLFLAAAGAAILTSRSLPRWTVRPPWQQPCRPCPGSRFSHPPETWRPEASPTWCRLRRCSRGWPPARL
jgi:hypothetical protein